MNPVTDENGFAPPLVKVTMRGTRELYLCNDYDEVSEAVRLGKPFAAHAVVGMKPSPVTINPLHVALLEVAR